MSVPNASESQPGGPVSRFPSTCRTRRLRVPRLLGSAFLVWSLTAASAIAQASAPPENFEGLVVGNAVALRWTAPAVVPAPSEYRLEVGSTSGASDLLITQLEATAASLNVLAPAGVFFVRLRALYGPGSGTPGDPTPELRLDVGCTRMPAPPTGLFVQVDGPVARVRWTASVDNVTRYLLDVGTAPGLTDLTVPLQAPMTSFETFAPSGGTFYLRIRSRCEPAPVGPTVTGPPSSEVFVTFGAPNGLPGPPRSPRASVNNFDVVLNWAAPSVGGAPTGYLVEVGSAAGRADLVTIPIVPPSLSLAATNVPRGNYYVRMRAFNAAGLGPPSLDVLVSLPPTPTINPHTISCRPLVFDDIRDGCTLTGNWQVVYEDGDDDDFTYIVSDALGTRVVAGSSLPNSPITISTVPTGTSTFKVEQEGGGPAAFARLSYDSTTGLYRITAADDANGSDHLSIRLVPIP